MVFAVHAPLVMVVVVVLAMAGALPSANSQSYSTTSFAVAGRKFKLQNRPLQAGEGVTCPEATPSSTVAFCKAPGYRVKIVGNFAAADVGVCNVADNPYTLKPTTEVTYEQYGDMVVLRIFDNVPAAFRLFVVGGKKIGVGLSGQRYGVSTFIDVGPANC